VKALPVGGLRPHVLAGQARLAGRGEQPPLREEQERVEQRGPQDQGTVACRTASVSASVRRCVIRWYSGSATMLLNARRLG
jgi:hypothetical protein